MRMTCLHCHRPLPKESRPSARYCDTNCRSAAYRARQAGRGLRLPEAEQETEEYKTTRAGVAPLRRVDVRAIKALLSDLVESGLRIERSLKALAPQRAQEPSRIELREQVLSQAPALATGYRLILPSPRDGDRPRLVPRRRSETDPGCYSLHPFQPPLDRRLSHGRTYRILWVDTKGNPVAPRADVPVPGLYFWAGPASAQTASTQAMDAALRMAQGTPHEPAVRKQAIEQRLRQAQEHERSEAQARKAQAAAESLQQQERTLRVQTEMMQGMRAVQASEPATKPFPWAVVLPGMAIGLPAIGGLIYLFIKLLRSPPATDEAQEALRLAQWETAVQALHQRVQAGLSQRPSPPDPAESHGPHPVPPLASPSASRPTPPAALPSGTLGPAAQTAPGPASEKGPLAPSASDATELAPETRSMAPAAVDAVSPLPTSLPLPTKLPPRDPHIPQTEAFSSNQAEDKRADPANHPPKTPSSADEISEAAALAELQSFISRGEHHMGILMYEAGCFAQDSDEAAVLRMNAAALPPADRERLRALAQHPRIRERVQRAFALLQSAQQKDASLEIADPEEVEALRARISDPLWCVFLLDEFTRRSGQPGTDLPPEVRALPEEEKAAWRTLLQDPRKALLVYHLVVEQFEKLKGRPRTASP